jgi:RimJ/RimL family protein N-acetyltransferase
MFPAQSHTPRLLLRPIQPRDAAPIFNTYAQDREVTRFLTWRPHGSQSETEAYIAHCLATPPEVAQTYVLAGRTGGTVLGALDLRRAGAWRLEFGYVLARACWGQGLMTEALKEISAWALAQPTVFRIGAVCDVDNIGSARVMEKAGLRQEGVLRRWLVHPALGNEPRDCFSYARVR